jgi:hypothetical protein
MSDPLEPQAARAAAAVRERARTRDAEPDLEAVRRQARRTGAPAVLAVLVLLALAVPLGVWALGAGVPLVELAPADQPEVPAPQPTAPSLPPTETNPPAAPQAGTWEALDFAAAAGAEAVWTGGDVLVFHRADPAPEDASVVRLDPDSGAVTDTAPNRTSLIVSIASQWTWTGRELVVWALAQIDAQTTADGSATSYAAQGVAYDPASGTWRRFAGAPVDNGAPLPQVGVAGASLDGEVVVWSLGVAFDPVSGASRFVAEAPLAPRVGSAAVRTTEQLLVWSGDGMADGAAYDPASDTWTTVSRSPLPAADQRVAVWTGTEVLVWDGSAGAAYDPARDSWRLLPEAPAHGTVAVWSGSELLLPAGAAYDPATDSWRTLPPPPLPAAEQVTAVWTGDAMVVVGTTGSAVYRPSTEAATDAVSATPPRGVGPRAGDVPVTLDNGHGEMTWER